MARHGIPDAPAWDESCKPGDPRLARAEYRLVASPRTSLDAAARTAREAGYAVLDLGDRVEGEAREVAAAHAALAIDVASGRGPVRPPCVLLSGGETTVTVRGPGRGGRNTEYALSLALALGGLPGACAIACGTDGLDGTSGAAGAVVTPDTLARCASAAIDPRVALDGNDSATLFDALGALVRTGPTGTNVSDFRAILIEG
jgi:hydroxypyruvate reductase